SDLNRSGASIGGPIVSGRTFFFGNFEGLRERKAITRLAAVPAPELIDGDFSSVPFFFNQLAGIPYPGLVTPLGPGPALFADNVIPPESIHPTGRAVAGLSPPPNTDRDVANFLPHPVGRAGRHQLAVRVDEQGVGGHTWFGRYALVHESRFDAFDPLEDPTNIPGYGSFTRNRGQNVVLGWTYAPGPGWISDLRLGFN